MARKKSKAQSGGTGAADARPLLARLREMTPAEALLALGRAWWRLLVVGLLFAAVWAQPTFYPFVLDDLTAASATVVTGRPARLMDAFRAQYWRYCPPAAGAWRPLTALTFFANGSAASTPVPKPGEPWRESNPLPYRAVQVALLALGGWLVARLGARLGLPEGAAWVAGLLFVVHPVRVDAVQRLEGRSDLLLTVFVVAGLLALLRYLDRPHRRALALLALAQAGAILSSEAGWVLLPMAAVVIALRRRGHLIAPGPAARLPGEALTQGPPPATLERGGPRKTAGFEAAQSGQAARLPGEALTQGPPPATLERGGPRKTLASLRAWIRGPGWRAPGAAALAALLGVLVLAAAIRWVTLGAPGFTNARLADDVANPLLRHPWWPACLLTPLYAAAYAWFLHFWPIRLKVDYGFDAFPVLTTAAQPALWKAAAVLAATAAAGWYWRRVPALAAGMALFFLGFLPASNLLYINRDLFSERALTLAGTGWAVVVAAAYAGLTRWAGRAHSGIMLQRALTAGVAIALLLAAGRSYRRVVAWRSTDSIWQQALHDAPASTRAWRAILDNRLGRAAAFKDMNALEEAHKMALRAIESDPRAARHYEAFAHVHLTRAALEPNPHLAVVSFGQAVRMMQRAVDLEPGSLALQESLARLLEDSAVRGFDGQGRTKAIEVWRRVVNEHPDREQAWRELYRLYMETNQRTPADQLRPLFQAAHPEAPPL